MDSSPFLINTRLTLTNLMNTRNRKIKPQIHPGTSDYTSNKKRTHLLGGKCQHVWLILGLLPIKAGWWDDWDWWDFSWSNQHCTHFSTTKAIYAFAWHAYQSSANFKNITKKENFSFPMLRMYDIICNFNY